MDILRHAWENLRNDEGERNRGSEGSKNRLLKLVSLDENCPEKDALR